MRSRTMVRTVGAATAAVLLLAGCGSASDDVAAPEPAPTSESSSPGESAQPEETSGADEEDVEWGDGVWPDGYSFLLPTSLTLQDEVIDPEGDYFGARPYRPITVAIAQSSLLAMPSELYDSGWDLEWLHEGLEFGARFYVENVMDSFALTQEYSHELAGEWLESVEHLMADDETIPFLLDAYEGQDRRLMVAFPPEMNVDWGDSGEEAEDGEEGDELPEEGHLSMKELLHDEGQNRLANVMVTLTDAEVSENGYLKLTYDSSQTLLYRGIDWEGNDRIASLKYEVRNYSVTLFPGDEWKVWNLGVGGHRWHWDSDIFADDDPADEQAEQ